MKKQKTHKATAKRFWVTGSGKLRRRKAGQDHFNSRENEKTTKGKRKDLDVDDTNSRIIELIPYK
ncbi:MAG: 50S ribosomal protein L35 [Candidatus Doudnabacteria bacterium CG10_big_fil_rev_8_21_14_0_10_41_10]|uniref:Large ribosomal subunit protein bL35 n=1 Tax=Candidatus Doudnabacteria bacterium CG10_big_fil_rev_8_21_14_0_10_41_10 TaxID=1974551 RepID=A0A2H0VF39_9BACT|nr:MAG: 50S ribosomal protein L35 [Candidatus Doudnabacteria bacterium CG10_big_fil_rev_8_21_14_0_10_41_10]